MRYIVATGSGVIDEDHRLLFFETYGEAMNVMLTMATGEGNRHQIYRCEPVFSETSDVNDCCGRLLAALGDGWSKRSDSNVVQAMRQYTPDVREYAIGTLILHGLIETEESKGKGRPVLMLRRRF